MPSMLESQGTTPQLVAPDAPPQNYDELMDATVRFERYRVLIRKLAHQRSGTGPAMTQEERSELRHITTSYLAA